MTGNNGNRNSAAGITALFFAALIWGTTFVAQSVGTDFIEPFTFNFCRDVVASVVLIPLYLIMFKQRQKKAGIQNGTASSTETPENRKARIKRELIGGLICAFFLMVASVLQQYGIARTSVGKSGFITALYIVLVPVFGIALKKFPGIKVWISVGLALVGLYLLSVNGEMALEAGDIYLILSAATFALQILSVDHFAQTIDGVKLSAMEFVFGAIMCIPTMLAFETPLWSNILKAAIPVLYAGLMSSGIAYTLQIFGQKRVEPTLASLIMSLEAVISAISGWLILGQIMTGREIFGSAIMFCAIILCQMPDRKSVRKTAVDAV